MKVALAMMIIGSLAAAGCASVDRVPACEIGAPPPPAVAVLLDWTGGTSQIHPHRPLSGLDLSALETAAGTLADDADRFRELVRVRIARIYRDRPENVAVVSGEGDRPAGTTIVHLTQELPFDPEIDIGEGEYDPCNEQDDNAAIIFGERIRQLGDRYTLDEWATVFANVCAHEIGHTLGYGHIVREEGDPAELMLDRHTMDEMRSVQRFIAEQTNCPSTP